MGIRYPIFCAGFGGAATPEMAAAVSNAGGFGVLGCSGMEPEVVERLIAETRELTKLPFGVNTIIAEPDEGDREWLSRQIEAIAATRIGAVTLFWGEPSPYVPIAHAHGVKVVIQVGSLTEAEGAASVGVDAVIVQGVEAGGHVRGTSSVWELLPEVVRALHPLPVLASGGIGDGAGVARALRLGAQGVSLGTRFVASDEAWVHPGYKQRIVESRAEDTVLNTLYDVNWPDAPHRTLKNKTYDEWVAAGMPPSGSRPGEGTSIGRRRLSTGKVVEWRRYAIGTAPPDFEGDWEYSPLWAGESCSEVNDVKPAAEIMKDLVRDAESAFAG
jgi:nitronate monooxygenase